MNEVVYLKESVEEIISVNKVTLLEAWSLI